ncbi:MAG: HIT family hydrolase [Leptospiraceae bacterium]|nr:HIT family hydrolase [Leptospiraceae bacterium]
MSSLECKICKIHLDSSNTFLYESNEWILREAEKEKNCAGYLYLEPKKHRTSFVEFSPIEYASLSVVLEKGMNWITKNYSPKKIYTVTISEAVPHIHFHLVPRYTDELKGIPYLQAALEGKL